MKKRILVLVIILTMVFSTVSFADGGPTVDINSKPIEFTEDSGAPFIDENGRTLVPLRLTMETYGAEVDWNNDTNTAIVKKGDTKLEIPVGKNYILRNGEQIDMDTESINKDGRVYLPIRFVVEAFGSGVEWDQNTKTVNIFATSKEVKETILNAYSKSYNWKNYDMSMRMDMVMPIPDMGSEMKMIMDMDATGFMDPLKMRLVSNMTMDMGGVSMNQPIMEMYVTIEENTMSLYIGTFNEEGSITWVKSAEENVLFSEILNTELSKELNKESIKDIKYFGKNKVDDRVLEKYEITTSYDAYNEIMGDYMEMLTITESEEDLAVAEILANLDDIQFIIYIDEETGEIARYEMDFSSLMKDMLISMSEVIEIPEEELVMLESMEMIINIDIKNINAAEDFKIPEEALKAELLPVE
ncbi:MAG: copper amine oxidase N-terminal domain-containing protein [Tissierellaceae bacterium]|nr:copper amine oxidase N-terminal domain-containing protein [Tissierellaceae bacterium]